jgi:hypothetical protein
VLGATAPEFNVKATNFSERLAVEGAETEKKSTLRYSLNRRNIKSN